MGCVQSKACSGDGCCCRYEPSSDDSADERRDLSPLRVHGQDFLSNRRHALSKLPLEVTDVPSARLRLLHSVLSQRGYYPDTTDRENQDVFSVNTNLQSRADLHLFAVFDGHGAFGAQCAAFARDKIVEILSGDALLISDPATSFHSAFVSANEQLHSSEIDDSMSGTTAIAVLVAGDKLYIANVGDSRAISGVWDGEKVVAQDLSSDQTPFRKDEYDRVRECGARVLSVDQVEGIKDPDVQSWGEEGDDGDPPRLWVQDGMYPGTAFSRSVGDSIAESIGVTAVPEVMEVEITQDHLFFVVASDGVFEFLSSQAVVSMVANFKDPRDACSEIAAESYRIWLEHENRTDDITIIIVHIMNVGNPSAATKDLSTRASTRSSSLAFDNNGIDKRHLSQRPQTCNEGQKKLFSAPLPTHSVMSDEK